MSIRGGVQLRICVSLALSSADLDLTSPVSSSLSRSRVAPKKSRTTRNLEPGVSLSSLSYCIFLSFCQPFFLLHERHQLGVSRRDPFIRFRLHDSSPSPVTGRLIQVPFSNIDFTWEWEGERGEEKPQKLCLLCLGSLLTRGAAQPNQLKE